jgi:macrolide transport system ATP-binding/permease protein
MALIELHGITRVYKMGDSDLKVLKGIDLTIEQGEFVAIMGPSGSGKSTLMQILGLLDRPSGGRYNLLGQDVSRLSDDDAARIRTKTIGFIFQMFNLLARTSAKDNVILPMIYAAAPHREERSNELLKLVGLDERMDHKPNQLSGGQQQRVAIARALVNKPKIIFADEPTGNLASDQAEDVLNMLKRFNDDGITIIMVTHEPDIAAHSKRIIKLKDGVIISDQPQIQANPLPSEDPHPDPLPQGERENDVEQNERKTFSVRLAVTEFKEQLFSAVRALGSNKVRSVLSILGILIGVAAVIAMLAIGKGAQQAIESRISGLGSNLLMLFPDSPASRGVRGADVGFSRLTPADVDAIRKLGPQIKNVEGNVSGSAQVVYKDQNRNVPVTGATFRYQTMRNSAPYYGRIFTDAEDQKMERVALIGQSTVNNLFGADSKENPVGQFIKINRINFKIIGILPIKGSTGFRDQDDTIVMPLETAMKRVLGKKYFNIIAIECADAASIDPAMNKITELMRQRHRLPAYKPNDFQIRNMADLQATLTGTTQTFTLLLAIVAAISLLVGGIGIMNIMLVSVSERTREIGLRKAVGATRRAILSQFLIEAALLSTMGGLLGIVLGTLVSFLVSTFAGWAALVTISSVVFASVFSVTVGVVFGFWPARKASLLSPIEALRYE